MSKKLTLVVGAGASCELGLPSGVQLKEKIAELLDIRYEYGIRQISGDYSIRGAMEVCVRQGGDQRENINPYLHAGWRIKEAMPLAISIDNFLDAHQGDEKIETCGKLAIARSILEAEKGSILYTDPASPDRGIDFSRADQTWLNSFWRVITENCKAENLESRMRDISLIVFNYDRCIEHYLHFAFQTYYGLSEHDSASLINKIEIFHPYGTVGELPWQNPKARIPFGSELRSESLLDVSRRIKTFTEGTDPSSSDVQRIRHVIGNSERVVFIGFAFHRLNMKLLAADSVSMDKEERRWFYATAKGISQSDVERIKIELANLGQFDPRQVAIRNDTTCKGIFAEHSRGISIA